MPETESYSSQVRTFVNNHPILTYGTLGVAVVIYSAGLLLGRMVTWMKVLFGTAQRTNEIAQRQLNPQNQTAPIPPQPALAPQTPVDLPIQREVNCHDGSVMRGRFTSNGDGVGTRNFYGPLYYGHKWEGLFKGILLDDRRRHTTVNGNLRETLLVEGKKFYSKNHFVRVFIGGQATFKDDLIEYDPDFNRNAQRLISPDDVEMKGHFDTHGNGVGTRTMGDNVWEGEFEDFLLVGKGRYTHPRRIEVGIFRKNEHFRRSDLVEGQEIYPNGQIVFVFPRGKATFLREQFTYDAAFTANATRTVMHDGSILWGLFDGNGDGIGTRTFNDGHKWEGEFKDYFLEGRGIHNFDSGSQLKGVFKRSRLLE